MSIFWRRYAGTSTNVGQPKTRICEMFAAFPVIPSKGINLSVALSGGAVVDAKSQKEFYSQKEVAQPK